jgi:hypothetical protein
MSRLDNVPIGLLRQDQLHAQRLAHWGRGYMTVDYLGVSTKVVRQVCFQDLPRHTFLGYLERIVLGHVYSAGPSEAMSQGGVRDTATNPEMRLAAPSGISHRKLIDGGKKKDGIDSWGVELKYWS